MTTKLLHRKPTAEMIRAGNKAIFQSASYNASDALQIIFQAMFDAAPEVKAEPVLKLGVRQQCIWLDLKTDFPIGTLFYCHPSPEDIEALKEEIRVADLEREHYAPLVFVDSGANPPITWKERAEDAERELNEANSQLALLKPLADAAIALFNCPPEEKRWRRGDVLNRANNYAQTIKEQKRTTTYPIW